MSKTRLWILVAAGAIGSVSLAQTTMDQGGTAAQPAPPERVMRAPCVDENGNPVMRGMGAAGSGSAAASGDSGGMAAGRQMGSAAAGGQQGSMGSAGSSGQGTIGSAGSEQGTMSSSAGASGGGMPVAGVLVLRCR